jgi:FlaA1/EpsC-like NDP-sugar epimerase
MPYNLFSVAMEHKNISPEEHEKPDIATYYRDKCIFMTGGTGYLGQVCCNLVFDV